MGFLTGMIVIVHVCTMWIFVASAMGEDGPVPLGSGVWGKSIDTILRENFSCASADSSAKDGLNVEVHYTTMYVLEVTNNKCSPADGRTAHSSTTRAAAA
jgi:hypothetical protein